MKFHLGHFVHDSFVSLIKMRMYSHQNWANNTERVYEIAASEKTYASLSC